MSLGLVVADNDRIILAAESEGLERHVILSKLRKLQDEPELAIVVTGGLEHWKCVFDSYRAQPNINAACTEIARLLDANMTPSNQAFGLLCGYENGNPICCRIDRSVGTTATSCCKETLGSLQVIGHLNHAEPARLHAEAAIHEGTPPEQALHEAIQSRIPGQYVQEPVETMIISRAEPAASPDRSPLGCSG